jgi:hypothetical protein
MLITCKSQMTNLATDLASGTRPIGGEATTTTTTTATIGALSRGVTARLRIRRERPPRPWEEPPWEEDPLRVAK